MTTMTTPGLRPLTLSLSIAALLAACGGDGPIEQEGFDTETIGETTQPVPESATPSRGKGPEIANPDWRPSQGSERVSLGMRLCDGGELVIDGSPALDRKLLGDFTFEFWFKVDDPTDQQLLRARDLRIAIASGRVQAEVAGQVLRGPEIAAREWYHLALVVDGRDLSLQVDATVLARAVAELDAPRPAGPFVFGGPAAERTMCGELDLLRLTTLPLYGDALRTPPAREQVMVRFDFDREGAVVRDLSEHHHDGRFDRASFVANPL